MGNETKKIITTENLETLKQINDTLYQEKLESGVNIKSINGTSLLGKGNLSVVSIPKIQEGDANKVISVNEDETGFNLINLDEASAVSNKLTKVTSTDTYDRAYATSSAGEQKLINVSANIVNSAIVQRTATGAINTATPTSNTDAATKEYVDTNKGTKLYKHVVKITPREGHDEFQTLYLYTTSSETVKFGTLSSGGLRIDGSIIQVNYGYNKTGVILGALLEKDSTSGYYDILRYAKIDASSGGVALESVYFFYSRVSSVSDTVTPL